MGGPRPRPRPNEMVCSCNPVDLQLPGVFSFFPFNMAMISPSSSRDMLLRNHAPPWPIPWWLVAGVSRLWLMCYVCTQLTALSFQVFFFPPTMYFVFVVKLHLLSVCCTVWLRQRHLQNGYSCCILWSSDVDQASWTWRLVFKIVHLYRFGMNAFGSEEWRPYENSWSA